MLIGELSRRTGVKGLLQPGRGPNGFRCYGDDAVVTVTQITGLLQAGLSTRDIGFVLPCATGPVPVLEPCTDLLDALRTRLRWIDVRIDTLVRSRRALLAYIDATERSAAASSG